MNSERSLERRPLSGSAFVLFGTGLCLKQEHHISVTHTANALREKFQGQGVPVAGTPYTGGSNRFNCSHQGSAWFRTYHPPRSLFFLSRGIQTGTRSLFDTQTALPDNHPIPWRIARSAKTTSRIHIGQSTRVPTRSWTNPASAALVRINQHLRRIVPSSLRSLPVSAPLQVRPNRLFVPKPAFTPIASSHVELLEVGQIFVLAPSGISRHQRHPPLRLPSVNCSAFFDDEPLASHSSQSHKRSSPPTQPS